jgi:alkylated DNA repair dioxygenase AlkB
MTARSSGARLERDGPPRPGARAAVSTAQGQLFGTAELLPEGLSYEPGFVDAGEERALLEVVASLPVVEARYRGYTARRRVYVWGERLEEQRSAAATGWLPPPEVASRGRGSRPSTPPLDPYAQHRHPLAELPPALQALRERIGAWAGVDARTFVHVMVSEYRAGTPLGWHRDAPQYELVAGVSLGGPARLRFRPWPPARPRKEDVVSLDLAPRSAYLMRGTARWGWQHSLAPVPGLRWSVTLRTSKASPG